MATFTPSPIISQISGSLGSVTFVTAGKGNVIRHRPQRSRTKSIPQLRQAALYQQCKLQWTALTATQQIAWNSAAQWPWRKNTNSARRATSGHQLFMTVNLNWNLYDGSYVTTPTNPIQGTGLKYFVPDAAPGTILISPVNGDFTQAGKYLVHGARSFRSSALMPCPRAFDAWRKIGIYTLAAPYTAFEIITNWTAILGALVAYEWYSIRLTLLTPKGTVSNSLIVSAARSAS